MRLYTLESTVTDRGIMARYERAVTEANDLGKIAQLFVIGIYDEDDARAGDPCVKAKACLLADI